jgi:hypothetical protein
MWHVWEEENTQRVTGWVKAEEERPLRRPKYRLKDNIKINLREIGLGLTQDKY